MSPTRIHLKDLQARHDFSASKALVESALGRAMRSNTSLVRFFARYTSWNGYFGSGVAALAAKCGRSRKVFMDRNQPIEQLADRSVFVGSFFFDAARDEFDDRDTVHRDTHRCLAQATLSGLITYSRLTETGEINMLLSDPVWLDALQERVAVGYGARSADTPASIFRAMGYHLGSEVLADEEFSLIHTAMEQANPDLVKWLDGHSVTIAGQEHNAWYWVKIHSGHGGGVEADHFDWAIKGVRRGFQFSKPTLHPELKKQVFLGFDDFARDHAEFFTNVGEL
ncbi:MAG: hypothetical protein GY913_13195 [Proteobacteria bacterium]|nr:hypothetical protein [Pseudomonadota bacterium]MCP4917862.1 hypothetical protein [Pseudomonadota bacterium]